MKSQKISPSPFPTPPGETGNTEELKEKRSFFGVPQLIIGNSDF